MTTILDILDEPEQESRYENNNTNDFIEVYDISVSDSEIDDEMIVRTTQKLRILQN